MLNDRELIAEKCPTDAGGVMMAGEKEGRRQSGEEEYWTPAENT